MVSTIITAVFTILFVLFLSIGVYRVYLHPLSVYPGPLLWSVSRLPQLYYLGRGILPWKIHQLHNKYGPIIRLAPTELSFITADTWNDIYGRAADKTQLRKDRTFAAPASGVNGLLFELDDTEHARLRFAKLHLFSSLLNTDTPRRTLSHAFSDKSLREQEPIILKYTNQFISILQSRVEKPLDIAELFNFLLFDTTGGRYYFGSTISPFKRSTR
jgi:hypothetical protein